MGYVTPQTRTDSEGWDIFMTDDANTPLALRSFGPPLLSVHNLHTYFPQEEGTVKAVDGVSFDLYPGRTLGIVGKAAVGRA